MAKYDDIDFTPTDAMASEAKRGLAWRKEFKRGGTAVGVARAGQLSRKAKLSPSTVRRMHSFFSRHEVDKKGQGFKQGEQGYPSAGRIAWALWGGDAGQAWARKKVAQMDRADGKKTEAQFNQVVQMNPFRPSKSVSKAVDVTAEMLAQIERVTGTAITAEDIVVFEASVANTQPLNKMGSIFNGGQITEDTLRQMAAALNSGEESVPLHTLHMQGGELPVGKVFQAEVVKSGDGAELRAMFYLPKSEASMVEKINLGIIDEVSIGMKSKALLCSKCGFDYFGADATFENLYSQTCGNDHTVGVDGTHVMLSGLDKWMELSLVSRGASSKPKILGRTKQVMAKETYDRIAADGLPPEAVVLFTASDDKKEDDLMDPEIKAQLDAFGAQLEELKELVAAALIKDEPEIDPEPEVEIEADDTSAEADSEREALKAELEAAKAQIAELQAAAAPKEEEEEEITLDTSGIPVGGVAASAIEDAKKVSAKPVLSAFKTPKR